MGTEKRQFKLKTRSELLKNLSERFPDFDLQAVKLSARLHAVTQSLDSLRDEALAKYGLSQGKLYVLVYLLNEEMMRHESPSPSEIADGLGVTPATVTGLLDGLERDGFIERHPHQQDRRALTIRMTNQSRRFLDEYMPTQARQLTTWLSGLDSEERRTLMALLDKIGPPPQEAAAVAGS